MPLLPKNVQVSLAGFIASFVSSPSLRDDNREVLSRAKRFQFGDNNRKVGWTWGEGPLVILVHGWGGRGSQMVPMAKYLANHGFEVAVFDAAAHGESRGWRVSFRDFATASAELVEVLDQSVHAFVGHSAGALGVMAGRRFESLQADRYVCLSAPRAPYVPIQILGNVLNPSEEVLDRLKTYYAQQLDLSWDEVDRCKAFEYMGQGRLLLIYDENDDEADPKDAERIQEVWPSATIIKTSELDHNQVLWDEDVFGEVCEFLQSSGS